MSLDTQTLVREQTRQLFQAVPTSTATHLFVVAFLYPLLSVFLESQLVIVWSIVISLLATSRFGLFLLYKKKKPEDVKPWLQTFTLITFFIGIAWACFSLFYLLSDDATFNVIFLIIACGVISTAVPVLAAWTPAFFANTFPQFIALSSVLIYSGTSVSYYLAASVFILYIMLISLQRNTHQNIQSGFQLQHKNDQLVSELSTEVKQREQLITERTDELNDSLKRLDFALNIAHQGWFDMNIQTGEILVSDEYPRLLGFKPSHFQPSLQKWQDNIHPEDLESVLNTWNECLKTNDIGEIEYRIKTKDGPWAWFRSMAGIINRDESNKPLRMVGIHMDITTEKHAKEDLKNSETKFRTLFDSTNDAVMISDNDCFLDGNEATLTLFGCRTVEEFRTKTVADVSPVEQPCGTSSMILANQHIAKVIEKKKHHFEWLHKRLDTGETFPADILLSVLTINNKTLIQATVRDISERRKAEEKLMLMAHYDALTQLPNRMLFADRFKQAVGHSHRTGTMLAICFLDLDNFKPVNDNYGHEVGDQLLIDVARRLEKTIREEDTISRQGGDEFTLLLRDIESFSQCNQMLERIRHALVQPYIINDYPHKISASIGATIYPLDNAELDTLLRHADQAMYQAKLTGKNQQQLFSTISDQKIIQKQTQLQTIDQALTNNEFQLYYQPKVNMRTGKVFGVEALIRWIHPEKGLIRPLDFLPIIEDSDLEIQIGGWVINEALQQLDNWQQQGIKLEVSINISSHHLKSAIFLDQLNEGLEKHPDVNSQNLQLEILESSALGDLNTISSIIKSCQNALGVNVALDDFGTGYSSLTHMKNLTASTIKIDQTFVRDLLDDPNDYSIIEGIIGLTKAFNRDVIAEGVETDAHGLMLLIMGCNDAQGYGISPPIPADDIPAWLANYTPNQYWLKYGQQQLSLQHHKIILLQLTTAHWFSNVCNELLTEGGSGFEHYFAKCHLGVWLNRFEEENLFDPAWLGELTLAHDELFSLATELFKKHQDNDVIQAKPALDQLKSSYDKIQFVLHKNTQSTVAKQAFSKLFKQL
ncbi:MAG: EAL domain-containing protein [Methylophagaceae bacterium]